VRTLGRLRLPIAFLFLAWPLPYLSALAHVLGVIPVARPVASDDGSLFQVLNGVHPFTVSVASACSGVNGVIGCLLVGGAFLAVVRGRALRRLAWLLVAVALSWSVNLLRILVVLAVGGRWGEDVAVTWLHPVIGLVLFLAAMAVMAAALPLFGLRIATPAPPRPDDGAGRSPAVGRAGRALAVVGIATAVGGLANAQLGAFRLLADGLGTPRLGPLSEAGARLPGWTLSKGVDQPWVRRLLGGDSAWLRYTYTWDRLSGAALRSPAPVYMDVVSTASLGVLDSYGIDDCYHFHRYPVLDERLVGLGAGVTATSIVYEIPAQHAVWTAVYWEWPVVTAGGTRYERVVLNMAGNAGDGVTAPSLGRTPLTQTLSLAVADLAERGTQRPSSPDAATERDFVISFAHQVVGSTAAGGTTP
jgi:exosortase/archaeosortase family protein